MNLEEYIYLLENPETVDETHIGDLKAMLQYAPYCAPTRLLLLKALYKTNDISYGAELPKTAMYASSPRALYFLLNGQERKAIRRTNNNGDYFAMMDTLEKTGRSTNQSLQELAAQLKQARLQLQAPTPQPTRQAKSTMPAKPTYTISEDTVKIFIKEKRYKEAIEILQKLSLNNPKKKSIFADQIRFLEKIS